VIWYEGGVLDKIISSYPALDFGGDHRFCYRNGIVYQTDMSSPIEYGKTYYENYKKLAQTEMGHKLNTFRANLVHSYGCKNVLDYGCGPGGFMDVWTVSEYGQCDGYDINPYIISDLKEMNHWVQAEVLPDGSGVVFGSAQRPYDAVTFWDSLEHVRAPSYTLSLTTPGQFVFVTMPIFTNFTALRWNKHFKPNEHFYYFTHHGIVSYFHDCGFEFLDATDEETKLGRCDISTFVFRRR
jgi:hypothetical protein